MDTDIQAGIVTTVAFGWIATIIGASVLAFHGKDIAAVAMVGGGVWVTWIILSLTWEKSCSCGCDDDDATNTQTTTED